jgi:preprotein translocase SecF subunit
MVWVGYRFRDFRMGVTALVALLHDVIVVVGSFAVLGTFIGLQVDSLFVTAMLTVIGYSVHDTIVVFDRIRENMRLRRKESYEEVVNRSINETLSRTIITSLTTLFVAAILFAIGGAVIHDFAFALLIGVIVGTYSSIFVASPLLILWYNWRSSDRKRAPRKAMA